MSVLNNHEFDKMVASVIRSRQPILTFWDCKRCGAINHDSADKCVCGKKKKDLGKWQRKKMVEAQTILNGYSKQNTKRVADTSRESYRNLENKNNHCALIYQLIKNSSYGYTDGELWRVLQKLGVQMQRCNVGARRHDINKILGNAVIINSNGETRKSVRSGKSEKVWRMNPYEMERS